MNNISASVKFYTLDYKDSRAYLFAALFVIGNILLPQLCHLVPQGGLRWLPIYFFTLVGAYKYGWRVGLLTAVASPLVNSWLFGMPAFHSLPAILLKSVLLAGVAGYTASRFRKASLLTLALVVFTYQALGTLGEFFMVLPSHTGLYAAFMDAVQDFRIGIPGLVMQVIAGYILINKFMRS